jgi:transposase
MPARPHTAEEFREAAAREVVEKSRPVADVARDCRVTAQAVRNWVKQHRAARVRGSALSVDERARLQELEKENHKLREQLEFVCRCAGSGDASPNVVS